VHEADRDGGCERSRRVTGRERRRRRNDPDRVERRVGERRARPVERLLQDRHQKRGGADGEQTRRERPRTTSPAGAVTAGADRGDQRPLHPPGRGQQEHDRQRLPSEHLEERGGRSIDRKESVEREHQEQGTAKPQVCGICAGLAAGETLVAAPGRL
jgi:hypothetical protein